MPARRSAWARRMSSLKKVLPPSIRMSLSPSSPAHSSTALSVTSPAGSISQTTRGRPWSRPTRSVIALAPFAPSPIRPSTAVPGAVVDHAFVTMPHQPAGDVTAHPAETDDAELHASTPAIRAARAPGRPILDDGRLSSAGGAPDHGGARRHSAAGERHAGDGRCGQRSPLLSCRCLAARRRQENCLTTRRSTDAAISSMSKRGTVSTYTGWPSRRPTLISDATRGPCSFQAPSGPLGGRCRRKGTRGCASTPRQGGCQRREGE